jgi:bacteriocin-like protein
MKKKTNLNRKHFQVHQLNNNELKSVSGGEIITCGYEGDLCKKLTVVTGFANETHKIVVASCVSEGESY